MKRIVSSVHFAWTDPGDCFRRARDELQLNGVELSFDWRYERPGCTHDDIKNMRDVNEAFGLSLAAHIWEDVAQLGPDKATEALLRELAPQLAHVHLADNRGIDDDHAPYRSGTVDWDSVLGTLRRIGFDGVLGVEFPVRDDLGPFGRCMADLSA